MNMTIVQWLLGKGADEGLEEALEHGVNKGQQEIIQLLLNHGANPNRSNALKNAVVQGYCEIIRILLRISFMLSQ